MRLKVLKIMLINAMFLLLLASCGGGGSSSSNNTTSNDVINNGVAQKGPFSIGSNVTITKLDSSGNSTGLVFQSKVSSKSGSFSYKTDEKDSGAYYHIQAIGRFIDESTGSISENEITLAAITDNPNNSSINVLTHWISQRAANLLAYDKTLKASLEQSQKELLKLFGIEIPNVLDVTTSSIQLNEVLDKDNALLLLLSGALMEASQKYLASSQTIINEIGNDFKDDGLLNEKGDEWFIRLQALIKDNPKGHTKNYAKVINDKLGFKVSLDKNLPDFIPLASRPAAIIPPVLYAAPSETITLDGSESHDSGEIINFTWFRVDQQTQYDIQVSDRFSASPTIIAPNLTTVLAAPNQEIILLYALVVTDADKLTHTGVVKVIIRIPLPENNPPIAIAQIDDQSVITNEDTPVNITLEGSDPDDDLINFIITTPLLLSNGLLEGTAPNLVYTPTANFNGTDHFNFHVDDGSLTSKSARVNIIVLPVNDPPVADDQTVVTNEDTAVSITLTGRDEIENDPIVFNLGGISVSNGQLLGAPPNLTYLPDSDFNGNDSFNFTVNDGTDTSTAALVNIQVLPVDDNLPPTANAGEDINQIPTDAGLQDIIEGDRVRLNGSGLDPEDGTNVTFEWTAPSEITDLDDNTLAAPIFSAPEVGLTTQVFTFSLIVRDTQGVPSVADTVNITVKPNPNQPPIANAGEDITEVTIATDGGLETDPIMENMTVQLDGSASSDPEGDVITYKWTAPPGIVFIESEDDIDRPSFVAPNVGSTTQIFTFSLIVTDSNGLDSVVADTVDVTVIPTPPFAFAGIDQNLVFPSGGELIPVTINGSGFDPNGLIDKSDLTYEWKVTSPTTYSGISFDDDTSETTSFNVSGGGTVTLSLTVTDDDGLTDIDEVTIVIRAQPSVEDIEGIYCYDYSSDTYTPVTITLVGSDPDGVDNELIYSISEPLTPNVGTLSEILGNTVTYTPPPITGGPTVTFKYIVTDTQELESNEATVTIKVCTS